MSKPNTELATPAPRASVLSVIADRYQVEPKALLSTLKETAFKGANDAQMMALCIVANEFNLNPFTKEIYAFPEKGGKGIIPVISIDGWIRRINEHPQFDGVEFETEDGEKHPISITCKIHRTDRKHPTEVTEYYSECHRNTDPWNKSPRRMLRHRALIQCARIAFGFGGSEPEEVAKIRDVTPTPAAQGNPFKRTAEPVEEPPVFDLESPAEDDPSLPMTEEQAWEGDSK